MRIQSILICVMTSCSLAYAKDGSSKSSLNSQETQHSLRNAFIKVIGTRCGPNHPVDFCLTREGYEKPVAVARIEKDGSVTLNPSGYYYGSVPKLAQISPTNAAQLWSPNGRDATTGGECTYQLRNFLRDTFNIDLRFKNNRLSQYRVRSDCPSQKNEKWFSI